MADIHSPNLEQALPSLLEAVLSGAERTSRNGPVLEMLAFSVQLDKPYERFQTLPHRNANPFALIAETMWMLAGRDDIEWLSHYLPRAINYSDDGKTWRGAYGPRIRRWSAWGWMDDTEPVDQVADVIEELRAHPDSRRAVISLWDPRSDGGDSKDIPCNNWLQFLIRDGQLHLHVTVRSNDAMWGWSGIDTFEWSVLHEIVANSLGVEVGPVTYFIGSLHLYEPHWKRAQQIVDDAPAAQSLYSTTIALRTKLRYQDLDAMLADWFTGEARVREAHVNVDEWQHIVDPFLNVSLVMLDAYHRYLRGVPLSDIETLIQGANRWAPGSTASDMVGACWEWLERTESTKTQLKAALTDALKAETTRGTPIVKLQPMGITPRLPDPVEVLTVLQTEKARVYGDSWKKHGELISIFANISRKYDRLINIWDGVEDSPDETVYDTVGDLANYCALYYTWLCPDVDFRIALGRANQAARDYVDPFDTQRVIRTSYRALERGLREGDMDTIEKRDCARSIAAACIKWLWQHIDEPGYAAWLTPIMVERSA